MKSDQEKWNQKFAEREHLLSPEPFLVRSLNPVPGTSLLDLASGDGRNAVHFARSGASVTAIDISDVGLAKLNARAQAENLNIQTIQADFDDLGFMTKLNTYDIIVINHFKPSLLMWGQIHELMSRNGRLYLCAFNEKQHISYGFSLEHCLKENEFFHANQKLQCESYVSFFEDEKFLDAYIFKRSSNTKF